MAEEMAEERERWLRETNQNAVFATAVEVNDKDANRWKRKIALLVLFVIGTVTTLSILLPRERSKNDDPFQNLPTPTEAPSSADTRGQGYPALPPTLQGIHERGYIRCRVGDYTHAMDLVSTL
jgi:hypothetical protein